MKVLVANLGSTSFKYRLFDFEKGEEAVAKGGYERVEDFGSVIEDSLAQLIKNGHLANLEDLDAVGFKTVLGKDLSGCVLADDTVLKALEGFEQIAPAHNPVYANGIRQFSQKTKTRLVALFETSFYQWMPEPAKRYAVPESWYGAGIRRYGFHGASHKFIAERSAHLMGREDVAARVRDLYLKGPGDAPEGLPLRIVSCHLGGSSSIAGIESGVAIGASMGLSPQSGLPQNNRVGDLDSMALSVAKKELGISEEEAIRQLTKEGGLLGLSGVSNDIRDIADAADAGNEKAAMAIDYLVHSILHWVGAFAFQMGGLDGIVFTAGIGENQRDVRHRVCEKLEAFGLKLDADANLTLKGEGCISSEDSKIQAWIIPTNEELVVAREAARLVQSLDQ